MSHPFAKILASLFLVAASVGCSSTPASGPAPGVDDVNYEGLVTVRSRAFDIAQVRPGMDLSAYSQLQLGEPQLAYRSSTGAGRQFALTAEQKEGFRDSLVAAFDDEFAKHEDLQLVDEPGPSVLTLDIRVEDIAVTVTPNAVGRAGRAAALLEASGAAVVIIELRDSQSNAILARGVHRGTTSGGALRTGNAEMRTRFESADKVVAKWAAMARSGLENLLDERR